MCTKGNKMKIIGERIKLSPFDNSDKALFIEMSMCSQIMKHVVEPCSYDEAKAAFEAKSTPWHESSDNWLSLGITESSTGEKLGNIGIRIVNHQAKIAEVGFLLKAAAQGKGFAGEALNLVKGYAFSELNLNKLMAVCSVDNNGSYKLLEKIGFSREGCLKQNTVINNQLVDDYLYGLCKFR